jgi:hypothetical protein
VAPASGRGIGIARVEQVIVVVGKAIVLRESRSHFPGLFTAVTDYKLELCDFDQLWVTD